MKSLQSLLFSAILVVSVAAPTLVWADMDEMPMGKEPNSGDHAEHKKMPGHEKMMSQRRKTGQDHTKMNMKKNNQNSDQQQMKVQDSD